ncbi:chemotaxis protein CheW [Leeia sp.]|uniref:chemotaxis protein CheW n=1 Tax=Leeia sp. TaxID=2884678 RepID=UPI0035AEE686
MSQFHQVFFEEAAEHLGEMESLLLALDIQQPDDEALNAIFRAAHSIKGGAGTFGFNDLTEVTHILENLLDRIRKHELKLSSEMVDVFLQAGDVLKNLLAAHQGQGEADDAASQLICDRLTALSGGADEAQETAGGGLPEGEQRLRLTLKLDAVLAAGLDLDSLQERLAGFGKLGSMSEQDEGDGGKTREWVFTTAASCQDLSEMLGFLLPEFAFTVEDFNAGLQDDADGGFGFFPPLEGAAVSSNDVLEEDEGFGLFAPLPSAPVEALVQEESDGFGLFTPLSEAEQQAEASIVPVAAVAAPAKVPAEKPAAAKAAAAGAVAQESTSIRVGVEKVDQIINLVGELVITQAMLAQIAGQFDPVLHERLYNGVALLERNTRELQEAAMSIRMMPISFVFSRFPRVVRDVAAKLGKKVDLVTIGENTEMDKGLIEKLADPLTHLVRNSLDHGIETSEARLAKGKPERGTLTLKAFHQGGNIMIQVSDDGGGLSRERILAKARSNGMTVSDSMTDQEVWSLIFEAGFSTAEVVTDVSGRGVGMDVVRRNIQGMGGRIDIESARDQGTTMSIRLPLTLAILDGMSVSVGPEVFVIPLTFIVESLQPRMEDINTVAGRGELIHVRGEYLPLVCLHRVFNIEDHVASYDRGLVIILEADGGKLALFVDDLLGQQQVVIKSLESNYRKVAGISGATIMGDGRVALIIDVEALFKLSQQQPAAA